MHADRYSYLGNGHHSHRETRRQVKREVLLLVATMKGEKHEYVGNHFKMGIRFLKKLQQALECYVD